MIINPLPRLHDYSVYEACISFYLNVLFNQLMNLIKLACFVLILFLKCSFYSLRKTSSCKRIWSCWSKGWVYVYSDQDTLITLNNQMHQQCLAQK